MQRCRNGSQLQEQQLSNPVWQHGMLTSVLPPLAHGAVCSSGTGLQQRHKKRNILVSSSAFAADGAAQCSGRHEHSSGPCKLMLELAGLRVCSGHVLQHQLQWQC